MTFKTIDIDQGKRLIDEQEVIVVDVRDAASYTTAHIESARHINDSNVAEFVEFTDKIRPLLVYCYHGHTSLGAAEYFIDNGFLDVYSLDGGFESWRLKYPVIS